MKLKMPEEATLLLAEARLDKDSGKNTFGLLCVLSYTSLPFPFHTIHPDFILTTSFLVFQLLSSRPSKSPLIYPTKHCQINCLLTPLRLYHYSVPNPYYMLKQSRYQLLSLALKSLTSSLF